MNHNCPSEQLLSAYHDGELSVADRDAMALHLASCDACATQLEQLRGMSNLLSSMQIDGLSQIALRRLHNRLDAVMQRGLIRWAWEVSGVAAAILLVGSIMLSRGAEPASATASVPPWIASQTSASSDPVVREASTPAAAWYLADTRGNADSNP